MSKTCEWGTPQDLFDKLNGEFNFTLDVCATKENAKCKRFYAKVDDGLTKEWSGSCWMNPPYGKEIGKWMEKAYFESRKDGTSVVCLIPARTDTNWWHSFAMKGEVRFLKGRLRFEGGKFNAPFPSAVLVFR